MQAIDIKKNYWKWTVLLWICEIPVFYIITNYFLAPCSQGQNLTSPICENIYPYIGSIAIPFFADNFIPVLIVTVLLTIVPAVFCFIRASRYKSKFKK